MVKALRYKSEGPGVFSLTSDSSMCPGVDSASKNEYQDNPGVKGRLCVRLTTNHLHVPLSRNLGGLNLLEPCGPVQACNVTALPLPLPLPFNDVIRSLIEVVTTKQLFLKRRAF